MKRKVALITGGATGIGKRIAEELAEKRYDIVLTYVHSKEKAEKCVETIKNKYGIKAKCYKSDASIATDCLHLIKAIKNDFPLSGVDIFIHNAGPYIRERKRMSEYSMNEWHYMINGNLNSFFYLGQLILPHMRQQQWGRIITFGFDRSETAPGWIYRSAYAAAKSGLSSLTKTLAQEEAENNITINMICPGDIIGGWKEQNIYEATQIKDSSIPIGRPGTGEDVARIVAFLCDESSSFITGTVISVTGGKDVLSKSYP